MNSDEFRKLYKDYLKAWNEYKKYENNFTKNIDESGNIEHFKGCIEKANKLWREMNQKWDKWIGFLRGNSFGSTK